MSEGPTIPTRACCARCGFSSFNPSWLRNPETAHLFPGTLRYSGTCHRITQRSTPLAGYCSFYEPIEDVDVVDGIFVIRGVPMSRWLDGEKPPK